MYLAIMARFDAVKCMLRGHFVEWWARPDPPICPGDIVCQTCGVVHWCRAYDPWRSMA